MIKERFTYYRLKTEGQITILMGGANQEAKAKAPIIAYSSKPDHASRGVEVKRTFAVARCYS